MIVGELYSQLMLARERIGGSATVRANVAAMGSNIGQMTVVRAVESRVDSLPDFPEEPEGGWPEWGPPPCPEELLPGPKLVLMIGGEDWESDDPTGPDSWERLMAPCATVDGILRDLQDVPMSWKVAAQYAVPGANTVETDATIEVSGRDVDVADIAQAFGDALYGESLLACYGPSICEEQPPMEWSIPERDNEEWSWVRSDGSILPYAERPYDGCRFEKIGVRRDPAESGWDEGVHAHFSVQVWS